MGSVLRMFSPASITESPGLGGASRRRTSTSAAPSGTVALVFTDVQGSTRLWERCSAEMRRALELHDEVLRSLLEAHGGYEVKTQGDAFMVAFTSAVEAVRWCLAVQQALLIAPWPEGLLVEPEAAEERSVGGGLVYRGLRVRMGVHLGEPECRFDERTGQVDYFGRVVNVAARVASAGHGGQVLVSGPTWARVEGEVASLGQPVVRAMGEYHLKGIEEAITLVEVLPASLAERRFEALRVQRVRRGHVPSESGELVGRQEELALLRRSFGEGARLVTLLGPGGMGKSRLATRFGNLELEACTWEGGVWMCELPDASTVDDICHAVGQALGVALNRSGEDKPTERLGRVLAGRGEVLVILDNVEQVVHHMPAMLGRWRALAPRARFLVTSREALLLPEERVIDLAPLVVPEEGETHAERLVRCDSVRLFVQRARAVRGSFELTDAEAPLVADIVRKLDGIPLAIELAAARTNLLGVAQIQERLSRRFELLRGGRRDGSARQSTLWGAIDWSWNLLEPAERAALAQCSVFRGGFSLEAAEAVLLFPPGGPDVMEIIHSLRSKSLLRAYAPDGLSGELRLGMYESIRQYASSRLAERGEGTILASRHAGCYLALARRLSARMRGEGGELAFRRLALERENLLAACDNALAVVPATEGSLERALGALVALEPDVTARGPVGITLSRLDRALELSATVDVEPLLRAEALAVRGRTHHGAGQLAAAWRDMEAARSAFSELGAMDREKRVLVDLSIVARDEGDIGTAWELVKEAQELPSVGDRWMDAYAVGNLGILELGRHGAGAALPHLRTALELFRAVGDVAFEVGFLTNYAMAIGESGGTAEAVVLLEEAMEKASRVGDRAGHALARVNLGCFLLDAGRAAEAREHLEATVCMGRQLGMRILEGVARGELGRALVALGALGSARTCLGESISILDRVSRWHALRFTAHLASVQAALGELTAAREGFASLEVSPEISGDTVLRELSSLLRASLDLAEAAKATPGSEAELLSLSQARRRVERARSAPAEAASSDLREALRVLGRGVLGAGGDTAQA
ncbi:adenylate/guanylate cyclase domain-containing protein [Vitiosangium sp. GDMCC 1.1324]|uniref:ATP-binding protein n=1 Tax=Vitiosangium sp. (strain GDMCC 1.1324) TaxID=2138576 RepID=UPI001E3E3B1A|nr:adenylate/guanylate cyclase domain-containing protein [Vitiosangium sp. GDMCC 1.1324]